MNLGDRIRSGVKWLLLGTVGYRLLEFLFGIFLARLLVPADFGMVITLQLFTGVVGILTSGGMGQSLIRAKHADEHDFNNVFTLQLAMGVTVYISFYLLAPSIAEFFNDPLYTQLMRVSALVFLLRPMALMRNAWLAREMAYKKRTVVMVISSLVTGSSGTLMAFSGLGVWSLILSGLLGAAVRNLLLAYLTPLRFRLELTPEILRRHSSFGIKMTALELLADFKHRLVVLLLSMLAAPTFLGLFNKAHSLSQLPAHVLIPPIGQPVFRGMSKIQDDLDQTKYLFYKVITILTTFIFPFFTLLWWVATPFVSVIYGEKWLPAAEPFQIMILAGFLFTLEIPCGVLLTAQNRMVPQIIGQLLVLSGIAVACIVGINWGLTGVAWGITATDLLSTSYGLFLVSRTISTRVSDFVKAVTPGVSMNIALFLGLLLLDTVLSWLGVTSEAAYLVIMLGVGGPAYLLMLLFVPFKRLKKESDLIKGQLRMVYQIATNTRHTQH